MLTAIYYAGEEVIQVMTLPFRGEDGEVQSSEIQEVKEESA